MFLLILLECDVFNCSSPNCKWTQLYRPCFHMEYFQLEKLWAIKLSLLVVDTMFQTPFSGSSVAVYLSVLGMKKRKVFSLNDISGFHATLGLWGWLKSYQFASRQNSQGWRLLFTFPCFYSALAPAVQGCIVRDPTYSHHLPLSATLQSQKCGVLIRALSSSKMLFIIIKSLSRSREIIVIPGLKTEAQMKGDGSSANARDACQGSCSGLCNCNVFATETGLYC